MSTTGYAYALQKTSKTKRSPFRKSQTQSDRLLWKSERDRFAENLKNNA
ncbi:hypothetical protein HUN01_18835 [Nostoc edaphicum CCNP1411]|uniref:Transposase n=1 Tax=Nostoc edaphicum CCNP1411 TaxID=1472755 RepID=A0A7D7LBW8_9NOSO|nr:hypothetical protein [Nostoc edaphicum]QMS89533.1 hypothetical protein HUN01_18835 [Nostoc edaphicum CCNP1411]